jgi:hypothetical protein
MQNGGFQGHPLMRLTLLWTLLFMGGLWCTNAFMFLSRMKPTPAGVEAYYLGSAEDFSNPRSAASMLETSHAHFPIMGVVVLMLTHLMIFAPYSDRVKRWFISLSFVSAFGGEAAGWGVRFLQPPALFAWLKLGFFVLFQGCLGFLIVGLAAFLLASRKRGGRSSARGPAVEA